MEKLIILGNGFDLACNWKTKYSDFLNYQLSIKNNPLSLDFISYLLFKVSNKDSVIRKQWKDFWNLNSIENWEDVESLINKILFDKKIFETISLDYNDIVKMVYADQYVTGIPKNPAIHQYFKLHSGINFPTSFLKFFKIELSKFESEFSKYLSNQCNDPKYNLFSKQNKYLYDQIVRYSPGDKISIMNFNYTPPYDDLFISRDVVVHYIHGECFKENIIIGVDPTNNDDFKKGIESFNSIGGKAYFIKTYRKMGLNAKAETFESILGNNKFDCIIIYGHSLNEQDYSYFQSIFDSHSLYDSNLKLEFCYTKYKDSSGKEIGYDDLLKRIYKLINEYGETLNNKDHGKNLLHKLVLEGRIAIREIPFLLENVHCNGLGKINLFTH